MKSCAIPAAYFFYQFSKKQTMPTKTKRESGKRELISPNGDNRYVRRDAKGQFKESDDQGRSLSRDIKTKAKKKVKPGYGDRGDQ
jgi:hypothetical protein